MRHFLATTSTCAFVAGCSLIYNPDKLGKPADARAVDAPIDAPLVRDADPSMLVLNDIEPSTIFGGQGVDNSPPATLVISGHNFIDGLSIDIEPATGLTVIGTPMRSFDGNYLALQVKADVVSGSGSLDVPLAISVSEPGAPTQTISATLRNLPTLETTSLDYDALARTTYARIAIPAGTLTFTGSPDQLYFRSISSVTIAAPIVATGAPASGVNPGAAGPGGCAGGAVGVAGDCMVGGGGGASGTSGGGGGGFANVGGPGGGESDGGGAHGNVAILNYVMDNTHSANQSAGGGGGAGGSLLSGKGGGGGGGGGGTVEIDAGGDIMLASVDVSGGNGGNGTGGLTSTTGGGGGGTGGVLVIRSAAGDLKTGTIAASGGGGGTGGTSLGTTGGSGGSGSIGRVRTDVPTLPVVASVLPHRNPIFDASTPTIYTTATVPITLHGTATEIFDLTDYDFMNNDHDGEPKGVVFDPSGTATAQVSLRDGYNKLCATLRDGAPMSALADTCIVVVYLP